MGVDAERLACDISLAVLHGCVLLFDFGGWFVIVHVLTFAMRLSMLTGPLSCSFADPTNAHGKHLLAPSATRTDRETSEN